MFKSVQLSDNPHPDLMVIGAFDDKQISAAADHTVREAAKRKSFQGKIGDVVEAYPEDGPGVMVVGLGSREKFSAKSFRKSMGAAGRRISALKARNVVFDFSDVVDREVYGAVAGEALSLLSWQLRDFKGTGSDADERVDVELCSVDEEFDKGIETGIKLGESVNIARSLGSTPPNVATPDYMAAKANEIGKATGLAVRVIRGEELEKERLAGLINVGKASCNPPCLIRLEYIPEGGKYDRSVVLLGKTVTYDTGGLTLKVNNGMVGMKMDKAGGCAVLGAMHAVATVVKPNCRVIGLLVAAENMVSSESYRPDDVITYRNGKTVEVTNTDAEGRLVLADGLCWASEVEKADVIVDLATLTGGVVTALGSTYAGLFTNSKELYKSLAKASRATGERVWRLPLHQEYRDMMKSEVADMINSNPNRKAHPIQGAAFLQAFVGESVEWAHIDIAGVAKSDVESPCLVPGPTGFGVRLLAEYLKSC